MIIMNLGGMQAAFIVIFVSAVTSSVCSWLITKSQCMYFLNTVEKYIDETMKRITQIMDQFHPDHRG